MRLPQPWKIKREVLRLFQQLGNSPQTIYDNFLATPIHDLFERRQVQRFEGSVPRGDRVAIYLVFPQNGLKPSHKLAIKHLRQCGYAPVVVSNLPLPEKDCNWLAGNTYKFLFRPNRGYDFGGYREGFLTLRDDIKQLEYLAFFNDSAWFPLPGSESWLSQAEALDVEYAAAASSFGIPNVAFKDFRKIKWEVDVGLRNFHYCSYALLVRKEILRSRAIRRYWRHIPLTSKKNRVVRVGEIGMTRLVLRKGFTHGATYDLLSLETLLNGLSDLEINHYARNLITLGHHESTELIHEICPARDAQRSPSERVELVKLILTVAGRTGVTYVLPELLYTHHGFSFLKKSPLGLNARDSDIMLAFGKTLAGSEGRIIQDEMEEIRQSKGFQSNIHETVSSSASAE